MPGWRRTVWILCLILPPALLMITFIVVPLIQAFAYSLYEWEGLARGAFIGLGNFEKVLLDDYFGPITWRAFWHNCFVFLALMVAQNAVGFVLAVALSKELAFAGLHRVIVFVPVVLSTVIVGILWKLLLHPLFGLVNSGLHAIGLGTLAMPWLGDPLTALPSLILANAWHWVGFPTLVFLAAIQRIPGELLDAARIDGAGERMMILKIIWPLVAPATTVIVILTFIGSFNWFELPYVMSGLDGSPFGATDVLGLYFYRTAFGNQSAGTQDFGMGSALAVLMFLFIGVVAAIWTNYLRRREITI